MAAQRPPDSNMLRRPVPIFARPSSFSSVPNGENNRSTNPPSLPPAPQRYIDAFDQLLHTSPVPRTITAAYESSRPTVSKPPGGYSVLSDFFTETATTNSMQMMPPAQQQQRAPEMREQQQKTFVSSGFGMNVVTATNGGDQRDQVNDAETTIGTKRSRPEKQPPKKILSLVEMAVEQHRKQMPAMEASSVESGAMDVDEPAPAPEVERDIYSPDITDGEEITTPPKLKRRKVTATKTQSRSANMVQTNEAAATTTSPKVESRKRTEIPPVSTTRATKNGRLEASPSAAELEADQSTPETATASASEKSSTPVTSSRERRTSKKVEQQTQTSEAPATSDPAVSTTLKRPGPSSRVKRTTTNTTKGNKQAEILATPIASNPPAVPTVRQTRSSKKDKDEASPTSPIAPKAAKASTLTPAGPRRTRLFKGGSDEALPAPSASKATSQPDLISSAPRQTRKKDNEKAATAATNPRTTTAGGSKASSSRTIRAPEETSSDNEAPPPQPAPESASRQTHASKKDAEIFTTPAPLKSAQSKKPTASKAPKATEPAAPPTALKPQVLIPVTSKKRSAPEPLEIPETPTPATGPSKRTTRPRRSLLTSEIPETPQEKLTHNPKTPREKPIRNPKTPASKSTGKFASTPGTVTVSAPDATNDSAKKPWENAKGLYNIPAHVLASSGTLWDVASGRRVSGRRHTVVFAQPEPEPEPETEKKSKKGRVSWAPGYGEKVKPAAKDKRKSSGAGVKKRPAPTAGKKQQQQQQQQKEKEVSYEFSDEE
ncbi:hypothetical protein FN846DRAFT_886447 [Sphaerosporella brunnea]|uniref:Uncharacterized protein n=1 Tax=Sphaerosporella brunnea TaxID=1250544 RepID=A0A5J5F9F9_9PEZI|nr:hypothetical protein FN846DRAFT_886447 [Sphaerosporella brunnea]